MQPNHYRSHHSWWGPLIILILSLTVITIALPAAPVQATTVYVTRTGKHYFYNRHDRGLNRAKKIFAVSLSTAKKRGLTLSATETAPKKTTTVKRPHRKNRQPLNERPPKLIRSHQ